MLKLRKTKCMTNYKLSMVSYWIRGKKKRISFIVPRYRAIKMLEINN